MNLSFGFETPVELQLGQSAFLKRLFVAIFGGALLVSYIISVSPLTFVVLFFAILYTWYRAVGLHASRKNDDAVQAIQLTRSGHTLLYFKDSERPVVTRLLSHYLHPNLVILRFRRLDTNGILTVLIPRDAVNSVDDFGFLRARLQWQNDETKQQPTHLGYSRRNRHIA